MNKPAQSRQRKKHGKRKKREQEEKFRKQKKKKKIRRGRGFFAPVQTDPGAHPSSYTIGTGSLPGVKRPGRGINHPPPADAEIKERVELYFYSPSGPSWPVVR
jgi:hypothetical protein